MRVAERDGIWSRGGAPIEELPDPFVAPLVELEQPDELEEQPKPKRRRWRLWLYAISAVLFVTLAWLIVPAPLSRALEPLDDPALLLVTADGHAIARRGAVKETPVDVDR